MAKKLGLRARASSKLGSLGKTKLGGTTLGKKAIGLGQKAIASKTGGKVFKGISSAVKSKTGQKVIGLGKKVAGSKVGQVAGKVLKSNVGKLGVGMAGAGLAIHAAKKVFGRKKNK